MSLIEVTATRVTIFYPSPAAAMRCPIAVFVAADQAYDTVDPEGFESEDFYYRFIVDFIRNAQWAATCWMASEASSSLPHPYRYPTVRYFAVKGELVH